MAIRKRTGELLISQGLITEEQLYKAMLTQKALSAQRGVSKPIGEVLVDLELVKEEQILSTLSSQLGVPYIDVNQYDISPEILSAIPEKMARSKKIIPVSKIEGTITVAMADPSDLATIDEIEFLCGSEVITVLASRKGIMRAIERSYPLVHKESGGKTKKRKQEKEKGKREESQPEEESTPVFGGGVISDADLAWGDTPSENSEEMMDFMSDMILNEQKNETEETKEETEFPEPVQPDPNPEASDFFEDYETTWPLTEESEEPQEPSNEEYKDELTSIWEEVSNSEVNQPKTDPETEVINVPSVVVEDMEEEGVEPGYNEDGEEITTAIIKQAIAKEASMVYFESSEGSLEIRYRIGNTVEKGDEIDADYGRALLVHFKRLAGLDIHENELPQSGRTPTAIGNKRLMLSVSSLPTVSGETLAVRILEEKSWLKLENLGLSKKVLSSLFKVLEDRRGTVLVSGPARSGKTSTMYSILRHYDSTDLKIIDIQSNFEFHIPYVNQVQVDLRKGFSFSDALNAAIEHQPDIVLLEELNDYLSSEIALRIGLGSLLITSVPALSVVQAITKLKDITLDPFLIGTSINFVINQRTVRKICPKCKKKYKPSKALQEKIKAIANIKEVFFYKGAGCENCNKTGFVGETGVFELVIVGDAIKSAIIADVPHDELKKQIERNRLRSIWQDGIEKVLRGITTFEELTRVL